MTIPKTLILTVLVLLFISGCASSTTVSSAEKCETPLPPLEVVTPAADVPAEYAKFVGAWGPSKWYGILCHTLVVESVDKGGNAKVIYSYGTAPGWNIREPGFVRKLGHIRDGYLNLEPFESGNTVTYSLSGDKLKGIFHSSSRGPVGITLTRIS